MAILSLVYVVATVLIAIIMLRANSISSRSLAQAVELEKLRSRPYLLFDLESRHKAIHAVLKNLGKTAAYNVRISVTPELKSVIQGQDWVSSLTTNEISFLAPNREISDFIQSGPQFSKSYPDLKFEGELLYRDSEGNSFREPFKIELKYQMRLLHVSEEDNEIPKKIPKPNRGIHPTAAKARRRVMPEPLGP
ncbi:MAG: hypothetical protein HY236_09270 [Acidobacteria bacterium]|nr:hypothetical protein [Acidobacteriota bacterium]